MFPHHACLFRAPSLMAAGIIPAELRQTYEVHVYAVPSLTIATVRDIIARAHRKPQHHATQLILIDTESVPIEAQNALLKTLEQPPETTIFALVVRSYTSLLPTVLSRCVTCGESDSVPEVAFDAFCQLNTKERLAEIVVRAKNKDESWFGFMEHGLYVHLTSSVTRYDRGYLDIIVWLRQRGASKKMLWEELALRLPVGAVLK